MRKSLGEGHRQALDLDDERPFKVVLYLIALSTLTTMLGVMLAHMFA